MGRCDTSSCSTQNDCYMSFVILCMHLTVKQKYYFDAVNLREIQTLAAYNNV